ncbi:hypothetical protein ACAG04_24930, partial [Escherichia coli]|uniref:hypothetical protein n=2 Tax=Enterobacterales TaxID=91347 RepID=UPI003FA062C9
WCVGVVAINDALRLRYARYSSGYLNSLACQLAQSIMDSPVDARVPERELHAADLSLPTRLVV